MSVGISLTSLLGDSSHKLLSQMVRKTVLAEVFQDLHEDVLRDILEALTKIAGRVSELGWHSVKPDQCIKVDELLANLLLLLARLRPAILLGLLCDRSHKAT